MEGDALAEVIRGAQRGDTKAYGLLVDWYSGRLFGFLYRLTGSRHDAEDLMQEVFVRLVRMIAAYSHDGRFEAWLFRIAANLARDRARRAVRGPRPTAGSGSSGYDDGAAADPFEEIADADRETGLSRMQAAEDADRLNAALAALSESEREVILLRHFSQLSYKEIADLMNTPLGTALARGHRGLQRLRELMGADAVESNAKIAAPSAARVK